jgi:hypothetical protein
MSSQVLDALVNLGILGPILALFGWYIWRLHTDLRRSEEQRVAEAMAVRELLLTLTSKWHELQITYVRALDANTSALEELAETTKIGIVATEVTSPFEPKTLSGRGSKHDTLPEDDRIGRYSLHDRRK